MSGDSLETRVLDRALDRALDQNTPWRPRGDILETLSLDRLWVRILPGDLAVTFLETLSLDRALDHLLDFALESWEI